MKPAEQGGAKRVTPPHTYRSSLRHDRKCVVFTVMQIQYNISLYPTMAREIIVKCLFLVDIVNTTKILLQ